MLTELLRDIISLPPYRSKERPRCSSDALFGLKARNLIAELQRSEGPGQQK
jgi:hypothetical protein